MHTEILQESVACSYLEDRRNPTLERRSWRTLQDRRTGGISLHATTCHDRPSAIGHQLRFSTKRHASIAHCDLQTPGKILIFQIKTLDKSQQSASWLETDRASARATEGRSHRMVACRGTCWSSSNCWTLMRTSTNTQKLQRSLAACRTMNRKFVLKYRIG